MSGIVPYLFDDRQFWNNDKIAAFLSLGNGYEHLVLVFGFPDY